jgi:hypothetical protein
MTREADHRPAALEQAFDDGGTDSARRPGDEREPGSGRVGRRDHPPILAHRRPRPTRSGPGPSTGDELSTSVAAHRRTEPVDLQDPVTIG